MNHNNEHIEQLRQELLSQDSSLGGQKETYIKLIERMSSHIPEVPIDKNFQNNLKSKLEYHISYINNLKENAPQVHPKINRLARLISYGLPTIALGVIIFLALPGTPNQVIAPTLDNSPINIQSGETQQDKEKQTTLGGTSQNINYNRTSQNNTEPASTTDTKEIPMMMQEVSSLKSQDTNTSQDTQTLSPKITNTNLEPRNTQTFSDNNFSITYTLEGSDDDIIIKGTLSDSTCKSQYTFSQTLVGISKDSTITLSTILEGTKNSQLFTVKFQDNNIISIQGEHICQISRETK